MILLSSFDLRQEYCSPQEVYIMFKRQLGNSGIKSIRVFIINLGKTTIKASDTLEHQPTVWPVTYAYVQPHHPGSGGHAWTAVSALLGLINTA